MNGQFKQESFDYLKLSRFADLLTQHGFDVRVQWRNGTKKVDAPDENTDAFELKYKEKPLLSQVKTTGFANLSQLDASERAVFLRELKTHNFYTEPTWALGLGLVGLYAGLVLLVAHSQNQGTMSGLSAVLVVSLVLTLMLLTATYFWAIGKIPEKVYPYFYLFGIGYIGTAPSSMLTLPLFNQCLRLQLYRQVTGADGVASDAAAAA